MSLRNVAFTGRLVGGLSRRSCGFRFFVALARCGDLLLRAKHLFVAPRTVMHGLQSSRGGRDQLGLGGWPSPKMPVKDAAAVA